MKKNTEIKDYTLKNFLEMALALDDATRAKLFYMMQGAKIFNSNEQITNIKLTSRKGD